MILHYLCHAFLSVVHTLSSRMSTSMNSSSVEPTPVATRDVEPVPVVLIDPKGAGPDPRELLGLERLESHARDSRRPASWRSAGVPIVPCSSSSFRTATF